MNTVLQDSLQRFGADLTNRLSAKVYYAVTDMLNKINGDWVTGVRWVEVRAYYSTADILLRSRTSMQQYSLRLVVSEPVPYDSNSLVKAGIWEDTVAAFIYLFLGLNPSEDEMRGRQGFRYFVGGTRMLNGDSVPGSYVDERLKQQRQMLEMQLAQRMRAYEFGKTWIQNWDKTTESKIAPPKSEPEPVSPHWRKIEL